MEHRLFFRCHECNVNYELPLLYNSQLEPGFFCPECERQLDPIIMDGARVVRHLQRETREERNGL